MDFSKYKNNAPYGAPKSPERLTWWKEDERLHAEFTHDALDDVGLLNHPKAALIFAFAWEHGHGLGHFEVHYWLMELAELLHDPVEDK